MEKGGMWEGRIQMEGEATEKWKDENHAGMGGRRGRSISGKEGKKGGGSPPFFPSFPLTLGWE